ncbi:MAG: histidine phosphatase family protein [Phormidesmis sp.]
MAYLKLLLIRHAQSLGNLQGQMEGQSSTALSALGQQQAEQLSHSLGQSTLPSHIYSSPLLRASQTTDYLTHGLQHLKHSFKIQKTDALQEMHQGVFQGLTWKQAQYQYPDLCARLLSSLAWQPVPKAESLAAARDRAQLWVNHILSQHRGGDVIWAVSHEGFLQQLIAGVMGCDRTWKIAIAHTAIFEFWLADIPHQRLDRSQAQSQKQSQKQSLNNNRFNPECWVLRRFNDASHLAHL